MNESKALSLIGLCYRAKKLCVGEDGVMYNLKKGKCKLVIVAKDASEKTIDKFDKKCFFYKTEMLVEFNSSDIANALGKPLVKIIGINDKGFKDALSESLK